MKSNYDVVIVGAGPAGSTAARFAAKSGCSVLLLEKDREIGVPVRCGEAVGEKGLRAVLEPKDTWIANRIDAVRLIAPDGTPVDVAHPEGGYILDRKVFDYDLGRMAGLEGAEVITKAYVCDLLKTNHRISGVRLNHLGKEHEIQAKVVIAADGVESRVGRWAGIKTNIRMHDMETCAQITLGNIEVDPHVCDFYFSRKWAPGGYVWVFPKDGNTANVGL
ncbi:geranylgeranyl reductase family protein, partial [candidate division KSB1 bacterium]|nr:geranylgeranyl reductase family protein [candidate division KSB1 bacterium]